MIIRRLSASFGRLSNDTVILKDGLNIIEAPNECGKSTWCAFIKVMLYGIRTSDRDKTGYLSDKTRYRPWSGAPMEGAMDLDFGGHLLTIERKTEGKLPMKDFSAVYTGSGTAYAGLYPDTAGETLTGVSESVFERSAYVSQAGIKISQTPELEKRISALVTTGDETSSYTESDERLRLWLRKRRFNKSGLIPMLEEKLAVINKKLGQIEAGLDATASLRLEALRLKKQQTGFQTELNAFDKYESLKSSRRAREDLVAAKGRYEDIFRKLNINGVIPDNSAVTATRGDLRTLESLRLLLLEERQRLKEAQERAALAQNAKRSSSFDQPESSQKAARAVSLSREIAKLSFNAVSIAAIVAIIAAAMASVIKPNLILPAITVAVVGIILLLWRFTRRASLKSKLAHLLIDFGADSIEGLRAASDRYADISDALAAAQSDVRSAEKSLASTEASYNSQLEQLLLKLKSIAPGAGIDTAARDLNRLESLLNMLIQAKAEVRAAEGLLKNVTEVDPANADAQSEDITAPNRTRREISSDLSYITARLEELTNRYNMTQGEIRAIGDPVILGSERLSIEAELNAQKAQYEALSLAIDTLKAANTELQTRFSPLLGDIAGQIIKQLTGGRYDKLTFDKALDASAKTTGETVSRNVLSLSCGTSDQIYLALRLAVCELLLPKETTCPLILDDALTNFDDERAHLALDYLKALSGERQILVFTCHHREAAYFAGSNDVNIIKIQQL